MTSCLRRKGRLIKCEENLLDSSCSRIKSYTSALFFFRPYLLCIYPEEVDPFLEELHKEICGSHTGGRSLSHRALT